MDIMGIVRPLDFQQNPRAARPNLVDVFSNFKRHAQHGGRGGGRGMTRTAASPASSQPAMKRPAAAPASSHAQLGGADFESMQELIDGIPGCPTMPQWLSEWLVNHPPSTENLLQNDDLAELFTNPRL
jgi:hypothetical protein